MSLKRHSLLLNADFPTPCLPAAVTRLEFLQASSFAALCSLS